MNGGTAQRWESQCKRKGKHRSIRWHTDPLTSLGESGNGQLHQTKIIILHRLTTDGINTISRNWATLDTCITVRLHLCCGFVV